MIGQMFQSITLGRCLLVHYFTAGTSTTHTEREIQYSTLNKINTNIYNSRSYYIVDCKKVVKILSFC